LVRNFKVDPQNIEIEVTESVFAANFEDINEILGDLKDSGISIAIDDFDTGYSSLARETSVQAIHLLRGRSRSMQAALKLTSTSLISCWR